jgi:hypothetical protein
MKTYPIALILFWALFLTIGIGKAEARYSRDYYAYESPYYEYYGQNMSYGSPYYYEDYDYDYYDNYPSRYGYNYNYGYDDYDYYYGRDYYRSDYYGTNITYGDPYRFSNNSYRYDRSYINRPYGRNISYSTFDDRYYGHRY